MSTKFQELVKKTQQVEKSQVEAVKKQIWESACLASKDGEFAASIHCSTLLHERVAKEAGFDVSSDCEHWIQISWQNPKFDAPIIIRELYKRSAEYLFKFVRKFEDLIWSITNKAAEHGEYTCSFNIGTDNIELFEDIARNAGFEVSYTQTDLVQLSWKPS